jgi:hypothetical protein
VESFLIAAVAVVASLAVAGVAVAFSDSVIYLVRAPPPTGSAALT